MGGRGYLVLNSKSGVNPWLQLCVYKILPMIWHVCMHRIYRSCLLSILLQSLRAIYMYNKHHNTYM